MSDTQATLDETRNDNQAAPFVHDEAEHLEPERIVPPAVSDEEIDYHLKAIRELIQNMRNRGDQDNNKVLDNMTLHLDAIDPQEEAA